MPFANDNAGTIKHNNSAGTIKQRGNQYHQVAHSNPNISLDCNDSTAKNMSNISQSASTTNVIAASDTDSLHPNINDSELPEMSASDSKAATINSNVLNDIGNMLANLTTELDAMLEEEKRVGLNDSE